MIRAKAIGRSPSLLESAILSWMKTLSGSEIATTRIQERFHASGIRSSLDPPEYRRAPV